MHASLNYSLKRKFITRRARSEIHGGAEQLEGFGVGDAGLALLEHPLLEGVEEDLVRARELLRLGALDGRLGVTRHADEDLVQLVLAERPLAALDHRCHVDGRLDHLLDRLHAVQPKVRLDLCNNITIYIICPCSFRLVGT